MTIHFYLDRNKKIKSSERTIYCVVRGIGLKSSINLNSHLKINPLHWDKQNEKAFSSGKSKAFNFHEINDGLELMKAKVQKAKRNYDDNNDFFDPTEFSEKIKNIFGKGNYDSKRLSLSQAFDKFIELRKHSYTIGTVQKYNNMKKNHLEGFGKFNRKKLSFSSFDMLFYESFLEYLQNTKNLNYNSSYKIVGLLKTFLNWAFDLKINKYDFFRKFKIKEMEVKIVVLNKIELQKLIEIDLCKEEKLNKVRDFFLFGCFTGQRYSDLNKITRSEIDLPRKFWRQEAIKTTQNVSIPLSEPAIKILRKYKNHKTPIPRYSNQKINVYIKELCQLAEIDQLISVFHMDNGVKVEEQIPKYQLITSHTARRTFVTESLIRGMVPNAVMKITGHKSLKSFQKYIDFTDQEKQDQLERAWNL